MTGGLYYEHSGRFSLGGALLGLIVGVIVAAPLALIYAYLTLYNPFIYINFLASIGFGILIGGVAGGVASWRKTRNEVVTVLVGLLAGLAAYYLAWADWIFALFRRGGETLPWWAWLGLLYPPLLWEQIAKVNEVGAWRLRSWTPTGIALWVFWGMEAATVLGCSVAAAHAVQDEPFCEGCNVWTNATEDVVRVAAADPEEMKQRMEAKDIGYLEKLGAVAPDAAGWFRLDLHTCPNCTQTNTLTVKSVTVKVEKDKRSEETKDLLDKLLLGAHEVDALRRLGQKFAPPPPAPKPE